MKKVIIYYRMYLVGFHNIQIYDHFKVNSYMECDYLDTSEIKQGYYLKPNMCNFLKEMFYISIATWNTTAKYEEFIINFDLTHRLKIILRILWKSLKQTNAMFSVGATIIDNGSIC